MGGSRMSISFWQSNKEVIDGLKRAIDKIDEALKLESDGLPDYASQKIKEVFPED